MLGKLFEKTGEELAAAWVGRMLGPSFVFWAGGAFLAGQRFGWDKTVDWWANLAVLEQWAAIVGGLVLVVASAGAMQALSLPLLRLLEGYGWPGLIRRILVGYYKTRLDQWEEGWENENPGTPEGQKRRVELESKRLGYPMEHHRLMPTDLGNRLRAAEEHPLLRYGLEAAACWPRLWLVAPKETREELATARSQLDSYVRLVWWGVLFAAVWIWTGCWSPIVGLGWAVVAYLAAITAAESYGELIRATFDLYRFELYSALHWELPKPGDETEMGRALSRYLRRGLAESHAPEDVAG